MTVEMTHARFDELVEEALDLIPPDFMHAMNNVAVLVEDRNADEPSLLGLYQGSAPTERNTDYGGTPPDHIFIYRDAILDMCDTEDDVIEEVVITVVQEVASCIPSSAWCDVEEGGATSPDRAHR